ncbi:MAG: peptide ABC transporter substrate-binding protein, partial [Chloroflexi bacterium]|nr:peptide ABC transporter substrate-binding protein [Chloroflexota bacterium]
SRTVQSYKVISQNEVTLGEATRGYELLFSYVYQGTAAKMRVVSVVRGTQIFTLVVSGAVSAFDAQQPSHDQIIRSFTLVEPKPFGVSRQDSLFYRGGFIVTLDPALTEESPAGMVGAMFSGLVRHDSDLKMVPDMAEKWDVSADGKTYTFRLREGVKFHNGKPVIAADFKYSWERALDPKTESQKARSFLGDIVGASEMLESKATELSGVKVIDDRTLAVTIDGAKPYFLGKLAQPVAFVVDRANIARGKNWTNEPNGTGPFKLKQWKKDELLILERNDSFYRETARLKNVVFQLFAGRPMMMYENGEIDLTGVGTGDLERVEDKANPLNEELLTGKSFDINYVGFNVTKPPFDDPKVRRAFAMSLNMDKILEVTLKGTAERAGGFVPPGIPGYNPELKPLPFDPVQAKQLIAESKYGSVDSLPPVTLYVAYGAAPLHEAMAAMWKQNLGVELKIEAIREPKEYYEKRHRREFQLFTGGWRADYIDPQNFLEVLFQSQSDENASAYSNPEVDTALKEAAVERDEAKRLKKYQEIEKVILNDLPRVPLYHSEKDYLLVKPYVKGLHLYPIGVNHWNEVSVTAR